MYFVYMYICSIYIIYYTYLCVCTVIIYLYIFSSQITNYPLINRHVLTSQACL